jgi:hypothetical protein
MDISPCLVCAGRKETRCSFCNGTGKVGDSRSSHYGRGPAGQPPGDPLEGTWHGAQGGHYELKKEGNVYRVDEYGTMGKVGGGIAMLNGASVTLDVTNALLGRYVVQLGLKGNQLRGTMNVMGMPMPFVLSRG